VPNLRTMVTEVGTGLGMLGFNDLDLVLADRSPVMRNLSPEQWDQLQAARSGGAFDADFHAAWENGRAFLAAPEGLRGRVPQSVEWKGSVRGTGDEVAPVDLRIDHVYLVSCKYLSNILFNTSPAHVFDDLLVGGSARRGTAAAGGSDWYLHIAPKAYQLLYEAVRAWVQRAPSDEAGSAPDPARPLRLGIHATSFPGLAEPEATAVERSSSLPAHPVGVLRDLPLLASDLTAAQRAALADRLKSGWPAEAKEPYRQLAAEVAAQSVARWRAALGAGAGAGAGAGEAMLWRLLRMGSAPYFVLGSSTSRSLRLRIATPWDWRQHFALTAFEVFAQDGGQPRVGWLARVKDRTTGQVSDITGHVEVRWSHGRFGGLPEAKGYIDTHHHLIPGYFPMQ
jgi:hypothetical protein